MNFSCFDFPGFSVLSPQLRKLDWLHLILLVLWPWNSLKVVSCYTFIGLTSFASHLSEIIVFHCLISSVLKTIDSCMLSVIVFCCYHYGWRDKYSVCYSVLGWSAKTLKCNFFKAFILIWVLFNSLLLIKYIFGVKNSMIVVYFSFRIK